MKPILLILALIFILFAGYYGLRWVRILTASEYDKMLESLYSQTVPLLKIKDLKPLNAYTILDTRSIQEYKVSSIPEAIWIGYPNFDINAITKIPKDKPILVYCSVGYRSERIGEQLIGMGFVDVYNLYGGIFEWANQDLLLVDSTQQKTNKIHGYSPNWGKWLNKEKMEVVYDN